MTTAPDRGAATSREVPASREVPVSRDLGTLLRRAQRLLQEAGVDTPRADAELLAGHVLRQGRGRVAALALLGTELSAQDAGDFAELVEGRRRRRPLQHLTGTAPFRSLELKVGPGVFLPRPETELLVDLALERLEALRPPVAEGSRPLLVDLCTGSGAIAAALAQEAPGALVHAVELDPQAAAWAAANLEPRGVHLHVGDARTSLSTLDGTVDLVASNPPYVPQDRVPPQAEAAQDPPLALYGGSPDGLRLPLQIAGTAARLLRPGGALVMEHDETQEHTLAQALRGLGGDQGPLFQDVRAHRDLTGRARFTSAERTAAPFTECAAPAAEQAVEEWAP